MIAQAMRAVLFARATATPKRCFGVRRDANQGWDLPPLERSSTAGAPLTNRRLRYLSPRLLIPPRRALPPVEFCRGTRPSQAANSRLLRNTLGSATVAAMAVAIIGPMLGMGANR